MHVHMNVECQIGTYIVFSGDLHVDSVTLL